MQRRGADRLLDLGVTLICWLYFTLGFLVFFSPLYLAAALFSSCKEDAFQRYNRAFYRGFFALLRTLAPRQHWIVDERIQALRSSVIVCNHLSYLDPLLLIALLHRSKTVVKSIFFTLPIFGWVIRTAGYLPATATGRFAGMMLAQMAAMETYLAGGGNLFVFPEGTRSRDGSIGALNQGALKIARQYRAPVHVLCLHNTDRLFTPRTFVFSTRERREISIRLVETIASTEPQPRLADLSHRVREALEQCQRETVPGNETHPYRSPNHPPETEQ